jgi:ribosomal protein S18 acetylase RimI-like enzyme
MVPAKHDPRRLGTIWLKDLDDFTPDVQTQLPAAFRLVGPEHLDKLAEAMGPSARAEILSRFAGGRICASAWVNEQVAAYGWVSLKDETIGELNLRLCLNPDEAYIWDCVTLPAYRQQHLYSALLVYSVHELKNEHLKRAWIGADNENEASHRGIDRADFRRVADLSITRVSGTRRIWTEGYPDVPDSLVAEAHRIFLGNHDKTWMNAPSASLHSRSG